MAKLPESRSLLKGFLGTPGRCPTYCHSQKANVHPLLNMCVYMFGHFSKLWSLLGLLFLRRPLRLSPNREQNFELMEMRGEPVMSSNVSLYNGRTKSPNSTHPA